MKFRGAVLLLLLCAAARAQKLSYPPHWWTPVPEDHYRLVVGAMRAKLDQNPRVREILLQTGNLTLLPDHIEEPNSPPEWKYFRIWMQFRSEFQRQP